MKRLLMLAAIVFVFLAAGLCWGEIPQLINYQGMLTQSDGTTPVADANYSILFEIYNASVSGDLKWSHTYNVSVTNGLFNVILGDSGAPIDLPFDEDYWLEITVNDSTLSPRTRLTSVGYAYRAKLADSAVVAVSAPTGGGWVDDGSVVRLETSTDKVGVGTDSPGDKVEVVDGDMNARLCYDYHVGFPTSYDIYSGVRGTYGGNVEGFLGRRYSPALGGNSYYGVYGSATTSGKNYGVYGSASGGSTNWAGYFSGDVHASGKVGIGTATPGVKLHIDGGDDAKVNTPNTGYLIIGSCTEPHIAIDNNEILAKADGDSVGDLYIQWATEARTLIHGKVGIGTKSPSERLDVAGNIDVSNNQIKNYYGFPKPNYDSGWRTISQNQTLTLTHNIYGDVDNYFVDLWFKGAAGRHNYANGGQIDPAWSYRGAFWRELTNTQIEVYRYPEDGSVTEVRVRIWVY